MTRYRNVLRVLPDVIDWAAELVVLVLVIWGAWALLPDQVGVWAAAAIAAIWGGMFVWGTVLTVRYIVRDLQQLREGDES